MRHSSDHARLHPAVTCQVQPESDGQNAHRLLLDVKSAEFKKAQPLEVDAFKAWQAECTERGKAGLWTSWLPKCVEIFRRLLPIFINGNSEAYYSSIATLQVCKVAVLHIVCSSFVAPFSTWC